MADLHATIEIRTVDKTDNNPKFSEHAEKLTDELVVSK